LAEEIPLKEQGGTYRVLAEINEQVKKYFIVDTGASEISIPAEVVATLHPETLRPADFLEGSTYRLADGRTVNSPRFRLRSLRVGSIVFHDVPASIAEPGAPLLLGQDILQRVGSWRIDNRRKVLILGEP
jgi:clan AA aspartic protease (TIGR02281 family)